MRKYFMTAFVLAAMLVFATSGFALEKHAVRVADGERGDGWSAGSTCSVAYYNFCTGWIWIWSGWSPNDEVGVCFDKCCPAGASSILDASDLQAWTGAPSGYGFTGTIGVYNADAQCCNVGPPVAAQPYLPASGWNTYLWGVPCPSPSFVVKVTHGPGVANPTAYATDHPAAGPTGPVACGTCYPTTRVNHSFFYGTATTKLCPGSPLNDGVCDAQFIWNAFKTCTVVSVEETTFGNIKGLYR